MNHAARQNDSRKIFGSNLEIRIALVVLEADIVARAVLFNQVAFENQSFDFACGDNRLEIGDFGDHRFNLRAVILAGLKILAHAIFEDTRLADVNNFPANIFHDVNARFFGQCLQLFLNHYQNPF